MCFSSVLRLMVIDCLSVVLFSFGFLCFCGGKFSLLSTSFSLMYPSISPLLIFRIFVFCPLFLICLHQVSAGPPIQKGTLPMLY